MLKRIVLARLAAASRNHAQSYNNARDIHTSVMRHQMLVGPPDAVSHLRPMVYDNISLQSQTQHPYSLSEFQNSETDSFDNEDDYGNYELKLRSAQLDSFNHQYWTEVSVVLHSMASWLMLSISRQTLGLKNARKLRSQHCLLQRRQKTGRRLSHTSTNNGTRTKQIDNECTLANSERKLETI
jgi:hypothetical protein